MQWGVSPYGPPPIPPLNTSSQNTSRQTGTPVAMFASVPTVRQLKEVNRTTLENLRTDLAALRATNNLTHRDVFIPEATQDIIKHVLMADGRAKGDEWHKWVDKYFFTQMFQVFPAEEYGQSGNAYLSNFNRLDALRLNMDFRLARSELKYVGEVQAILRESRMEDTCTTEQRKELIAMLIKNVKAESSKRGNTWLLGQLHNHLKTKVYSTVESLLQEISMWLNTPRQAWNLSLKSGWLNPELLKGRNITPREGYTNPEGEVPVKVSGKIRGRERDKDPKKGNPPPPARADCDGCGRSGHTKADCTLRGHKDWNGANKPWAQSDAMRLLQANNVLGGDGKPLRKLPHK